jgi:hypothetical protein
MQQPDLLDQMIETDASIRLTCADAGLDYGDLKAALLLGVIAGAGGEIGWVDAGTRLGYRDRAAFRRAVEAAADRIVAVPDPTDARRRLLRMSPAGEAMLAEWRMKLDAICGPEPAPAIETAPIAVEAPVDDEYDPAEEDEIPIEDMGPAARDAALLAEMDAEWAARDADDDLLPMPPAAPKRAAPPVYDEEDEPPKKKKNWLLDGPGPYETTSTGIIMPERLVGDPDEPPDEPPFQPSLMAGTPKKFPWDSR